MLCWESWTILYRKSPQTILEWILRKPPGAEVICLRLNPRVGQPVDMVGPIKRGTGTALFQDLVPAVQATIQRLLSRKSSEWGWHITSLYLTTIECENIQAPPIHECRVFLQRFQKANCRER